MNQKSSHFYDLLKILNSTGLPKNRKIIQAFAIQNDSLSSSFNDYLEIQSLKMQQFKKYFLGDWKNLDNFDQRKITLDFLESYYEKSLTPFKIKTEVSFFIFSSNL